MQYQDIIKAIFVSRPNRFIATVIVNGMETTTHVKNTGRCKELLVPGCTVYLEDHINRMGTRKMRYSLIGVEKRCADGQLLMINMDSQAPNMVAKEALQQGIIQLPGLKTLAVIKPEQVYGESRFDFYLEDIDGNQGYLEVKGCTLEDNGVASFPDAPTDRGVKHIRELIHARQNGYSAGVLFVIQMKGMKLFRPNDITHRAFGDALRDAKAAGVEILAYECDVTCNTLHITDPVPVFL